ncbi:c-di-GMP-binding flagellar brake protein YcgR [Bacillus oleivorans]|uniref:C-di-GMP-binding flagellar brake protein YcgR n=1 Tax=Bacillus oleivorans TaxID=1448271 RepID=A0A285CKN7_9BACI|nr:PilZ domain-containing protein [Bacillus oleivorans]SNX68122.1 c-di-GMP-binding flagellar brake protein YcgR [Bacillus oleivorans]
MFKLGSQLKLSQTKDNHTEEFQCAIMDYSENEVIVDIPVHVERDIRFDASVNTEYQAKYINDEGQLFLFEVTVAGRKADQIPLIILSHSGKKDFVKIEQRQFLRVDTKLDVAIHPIENEFPPFTALTKDISAGGAAIYIPKDVFFYKGMEIDCWLVLHMQSGQIQYLKLRSEVVLVREDYNKKSSLISVSFRHKHEQEKQLLIRYCFERQLVLKKKIY